ncbi:DUF3618 domain-containing protein [Allonocardiopsis opalescens]|uniref:Uncharacterized protein DUF3618 n=1 Tax=Allonocardiopsis opalescens TaxID=1144618 RepID=A0A2T0PW55_9ACTN|nr:DUF3618 domain-containing protein [Allonocardiopsis opalescens]PRX95761.1 uncharacterized protein DUF3618 [Allonocardiopsis opalescens]
MPAQDPDEVQQRIERTRAQLAVTIDEIADRVSPRRVARRGVDRIRAAAEDAVDSVASLVTGDAQQLVRGRTTEIEPAPGSVTTDQVVSTDYEVRPVGPPTLLLIGAGAAVAAVGVYILWRSRRRR